MSDMHLRQPFAICKPGFTYITSGPFTKIKERMQEFKETGNSRYIYQNELIKSCFQHMWIIGIYKVYLEERFLIKYYLIKHFLLLKIQNIMDT